MQTESVTGALQEGFGIDPTISVIVLGLTCFLTIAGGLKRISSIMERVVPFMAMLYILGGIGILLMNLPQVPSAVALIFKSAFTPMAGVGGFAGATVRDAIRYGIARGLYSNDAGTGYGIIAHASAKTDHPVRQASWGWGEVFLDTIVVCSVTALSLILTNAYIDYPDVDSAQLTTVAFKVAFGPFGGWFMAIAITIFAWTTIIGMYYSCEKSVNYAFGDTKANRRATWVYMVYYMLPCVLFYNIEADTLWAMTDLLALETMPSLHEARIAADLAEELGADYYVSFSCRDGSHICEGDSVEDCARTLAEGHPHLRMIGVNCTPPQFAESLVTHLRGCCGLPVVVYPNSGETYDPATKTWHGTPGGPDFGDYARRWMRAGAAAVGGCCRTVDSHIRQAARSREIYLKLGR